MLSEIQVLFIVSGLAIAAVFPVLLLAESPIKMDAFRNIGLLVPVIAGLIGTAFLWWVNPAYQLQLEALIWIITVLSIKLFYRNKPTLHYFPIAIATLLGLVVLTRAFQRLIPIENIVLSLVSGIFSGGVLAILIHRALAIKYQQADKVIQRFRSILAGILGMRLFWCIFQLSFGETESRFGAPETIRQFLQWNDVGFLSAGILLGLALPFWFSLSADRFRNKSSWIQALTILIIFANFAGQGFLLHFLIQYGIVF